MVLFLNYIHGQSELLGVYTSKELALQAATDLCLRVGVDIIEVYTHRVDSDTDLITPSKWEFNTKAPYEMD